MSPIESLSAVTEPAPTAARPDESLEREAARGPAAPGTGPDVDFVQLFTRAQRSLYLFILSQVPSPVDAEEILQEANLVIWRKMDRFQPGTSFSAWSNQIALLEVLKFRERRQRDRLRFSDTFIERVAEEVEASSDHLEERQRALTHCLGKLRKEDRSLLEQRYAPGASGLTLAERLGRPVNSVYQSLGRIRRALIECVNRRLAAEAGQ